MISFSELKNVPINFIQINCIHKVDEYKKVLDFTLWCDLSQTFELKAYRVLLNTNEAYEFLKYFEEKKIPCDYKIHSAYDEEVLIGIKQKNADYQIEGDIKEKIELVEFKVADDSYFLLLNNLIKNNVKFYDESLEDFFSFKNLVLNKHNTNISVRLFSPKKGYRMRYIKDLINKDDLRISALEPVKSIPTKDGWIKKDKYYEATLDYVEGNIDFYKLYVDEEFTQNKLCNYLSAESYITIFGKYFYLELISKFLEAWYLAADVRDEVLVQPETNIEVSKTRSSTQKTITVENYYRIPTIKIMRSLIERYSMVDSLDYSDEMLEELSRLGYDSYIITCLRPIINIFKHKIKFNTLNLKILLDNAKSDYNKYVLATCCIKNTILSTEYLANIFNKNQWAGTTWLSSSIFKYVVGITTY